MTINEFNEQYKALAHAIQTGVSYDQATGSEDGSPKHLRVGVNLRALDHAGLVKVLVDKGIIKEGEYYDAAISMMKLELASYTALVERKIGKKIELL